MVCSAHAKRLREAEAQVVLLSEVLAVGAAAEVQAVVLEKVGAVAEVQAVVVVLVEKKVGVAEVVAEVAAEVVVEVVRVDTGTEDEGLPMCLRAAVPCSEVIATTMTWKRAVTWERWSSTMTMTLQCAPFMWTRTRYASFARVPWSIW